MIVPFDPTPDDLARIDRARAEAWLTAHGWEACPWMLPERAGCWWRHGGHEFSSVRHMMVVPADGVADAARRWLEVLYAVAEANRLRWLALSAVVVAWQVPSLPDVGGTATDRHGVTWTRCAPDGQFGDDVWWRLDGGREHRIGSDEGVALGLPAVEVVP